MMTHKLHAIGRQLPRQAGLSLVELMISIVIGMLLLLALSSLLVANSQTNKELNRTGNQIENGRYATQLLTDEIHHAGFYGTYSPVGATRLTPDPCATALTGLGFSNTLAPVAAASVNVPVGIYGYAGGVALPSTCTAITNRMAGTAALVVRRANTIPTTVAAAVAAGTGDTYIQVSTCPNSLIDAVPFVVATASSAANFPLTQSDCLSSNLAPLWKYMVSIYYISSCSDCVANDGIPTLKVVQLVNGALSGPTPLVEGIENFQLDYGIDMDGNGAVDCYTSNPTSPPASEISTAVCPQTSPVYVWTNPVTNWSNVVAVRVNLLSRNLERTAGWVDTHTYDMGLVGATTATNDAYKRHVYSAIARLNNLAGQREK